MLRTNLEKVRPPLSDKCLSIDYLIICFLKLLYMLYFLIAKGASVNLLQFERILLGKKRNNNPAPRINQSKAVLFFFLSHTGPISSQASLLGHTSPVSQRSFAGSFLPVTLRGREPRLQPWFKCCSPCELFQPLFLFMKCEPSLHGCEDARITDFKASCRL